MCSNTIHLNTYTSEISPKPSRKTRTKTRKPKFLSLRQEISPESDTKAHLRQGISTESDNMAHHHQLNLFPLHPENLFQEKEVHENIDYLLDQDVASASTLTGLLGASSTDSLSPSLTYAYGEQDRDRTIELALTALRSHTRQRDVSSEEKWVSYSDVAVVPTRKEEEEVEERRTGVNLCYRTQGLSLKLDYQEILNAWSDKAPLYIGGESPQTVPDLQAQDSSPSVYVDVGCMGNGRIWNVPDGCSEIEDGGGGGKVGQREARVMRYKEKRQTRLFSKRIRYEVRKLNAEKRPRMKGRFVKRKDSV